jgi:N-acyl-D-amino-acid deacylase
MAPAPPAGAILFQMDKADVQRIMQHDLSMIGSDGLPHDRFPRVLGHYSRDLKLFSLETAVHKMTGRTAAVFGLADLVLFDADTIKDMADFDHPTRPAEGIIETRINGQSAYAGSTGVTDVRAGRLITRST